MSQNPIQIPTTSPLPGLTMVNEANAALASLASILSGASAPTAAGLGLSSTAGVVWHDTSNGIVYIRDQADANWIALFALDETNKVASPNLSIAVLNGAATIGNGEHAAIFSINGASTLTLTQTTSLVPGFAFRVIGTLAAATVNINAADAINGGTAGAGIIVPIGHFADFVTDGNGTWYVTIAAGRVNITTVASAATVDLGAQASPTVNITGTTTITGFGSSAVYGQQKSLIFSGGMTLTNGSNLLLPGGANVATASGDSALAMYLGSGQWRIVSYQRANGQPLVGAAQPPPALFKNLKIANGGSPNSQVAISADFATVWNGSAAFTMVAPSTTIGTGTTGANGLDSGTVAANTWYAVWLIYNPTTQAGAGLLSASATSPALPTGYTYAARFGWVRTDGSGNLLRTLQLGRRAQYVVTSGSNTPNLPQMASGTAGSVSTPTWVAVSTSGFVPTTASRMEILLIKPDSIGEAMVAPNNEYGAYSSTSNPPPVIAYNPYQNSIADLALESVSVYWANSDSNGALFCLGWEDNI